MAGFSIVTNISSLQAQENLTKTNNLQQRTITRLTSGLRINTSADDAAGLSIANRFRSDITVLRQGVRNAADGLSTLQTIDGGLNNISLLIDRARTLATQSASGTFTGDRSVLNLEFESVITEINRQAQAVGLDPAGEFNTLLSVFIGGGRENAGTSQVDNGSVQIDLSNSAVSARTLGLQGFQATGVSTTDIGTGSATTSVEDIVGDATNVASLDTAGFTEFRFRGPGFSDDESVSLSVNLSGVVDSSTLVTAINSSIDGLSPTNAAEQAFIDSGITASVNTAADGTQQLAFSSSNTAFQVAAGDQLSNALLGNIGSGATGSTLNITSTGAAVSGAATDTVAAAAAGTITFRIQGGGLASALEFDVTASAAETVGSLLTDLESQINSNSTLAAAGISLTASTAGSALVFTSDKGERFEVLVGGDLENHLGFGSFRNGDNSTPLDTQFTGGATAGAITQAATFSLAVGGTVETVALAADTGADAAQRVTELNAAFATNATLSAAGLQATISGGAIRISSANGTEFQLAVEDTNSGFGFTTFSPATASNTIAEAAGFAENTFNSGGADASSIGDVTSFTDIAFGGDDQTITFTANDNTGAEQSLSVVLQNDATARTGQNIDEVVQEINRQLQESNNSTLNQIVAVKERNDAGTAEGIRFLSGLQEFKVSVGATEDGGGINGGTASVLTSDELTGGSVANISSKENAETAVNLLATAVSRLSVVQADVGKGQNNLQFAIDLATTQITNLSAAESRIRDADLAAEAANLVRTQIQQQAGVAALAQANSAPQAILSLLRG